MGSTGSSTVARGSAVPIPLAGTLLAGRRARLLAGAAVILIVSGAIVATRASSAPPAAPVRTAPVARGTVTQTVAVSGSVNPLTQTRLSFKSGGRLAETLVAVGQTVTVGQALARLDTTDLLVSLAQAKASLASAQAKYDQTAAGASAEDISVAQQSVENARRSFDETKKTTQNDVDAAKAALDNTTRTGQNDLAAAQQSLTKLQNAYSSAKTNLATAAQGARGDTASFSNDIDALRISVGTAISDVTSNSSTDAKAAATSLYSAQAALVLAQTYAQGALLTALTDYTSAYNTLTGDVANFDGVAGSGGDTSAMNMQYQKDQLAYTTAASKLTSAFDAPVAQVQAAQTSANSAQTSLNTSNARLDGGLDQSRTDVINLQNLITATLQLATSAKAKIGQAGTYTATITDYVGGSYVAAQQQYTTARDKNAVAVQQATQTYQSTLEKSNATIISSQNSLDSAVASLNKTAASPKSYDIASAYAGVLSAQASLDKANNDVTNATLTAPSAGVIASISSLPGEFVAGGNSSNPFMVLSNTTSVALHGTVGEADVAKLRQGQVATVTVDAIGAATRLTGRVTSLDPVATIQQGVPVYGVDVTVDIVDPAVRPGMTGTANVIIASRQNVLTVPNLAIRSQSGRRYVQVMRGGQPEDTDVTFGIANDTVTEVTSGLQDGDLVVLPAPRAPTSGQPNPGAGFGGPVPGGGPGVQIRR